MNETRSVADPAYFLTKKSTQDLLDRLTWLEGRVEKAEGRIGHWMTARADLEDKIADVRRALTLRGIVDVPK